MIHVLHVVGNMDYGGAETLLMELYRHIDHERFVFDFLVHDHQPGFYDDEIVTLGGQILRVPSIGATSYRTHVKALRNIFYTIDSKTIIHAHINAMNGIILQQARRAGAYVRISHSHTHNAQYPLSRIPLRNFSKHLIGRNATHSMACSIEAAKFLHSGHLLDESFILNNAIDLERFQPNTVRRNEVRRKLGIGENYVFGHVGRFEAEKNHRLLLEIFHRIHRSQPNARLILVGVGSLIDQVRGQAHMLGLDESVLFLGPRSDVPDLMDAMDTFLFPSLYEGLGIVAIEAQAMGLPVIASESIPKATAVTSLITYLPLNDPSLWVDHALAQISSVPSATRGGYGDDIRAKGFEINSVAAQLQCFYGNALSQVDELGGSQ